MASPTTPTHFRSRAPLGLSWGSLGSSVVSRGLTFAFLKLSWARPGALGLSWALLALSWGSLGLSWGSLGALLGTFWGLLGLSWGSLGALLASLRARTDLKAS